MQIEEVGGHRYYVWEMQVYVERVMHDGRRFRVKVNLKHSSTTTTEYFNMAQVNYMQYKRMVDDVRNWNDELFLKFAQEYVPDKDF